MRPWSLGILLTLATVLSAPSAPAGGAPDAEVTIRDFEFDPPVVTIQGDLQAGNTIRFTYVPDGVLFHEPRSDRHLGFGEGQCMDSHTLMFPGDVKDLDVTYTLECLQAIVDQGAAGPGFVEIRYHCHVHDFMLGTVVVQLV